MNERIKALILLADIKFDKDLDEIDVCILLPQDLEKFAELIIKECVDHLNACSTAFDGTLGTDIKEISCLVKEHFGVE